MQSSHLLSSKVLPKIILYLILLVFLLKAQRQLVKILLKIMVFQNFFSKIKYKIITKKILILNDINNIIIRSRLNLVKRISNKLYKLIMLEISRSNNNNILPYIIFLMIFNNHIPIYILNVINAS